MIIFVCISGVNTITKMYKNVNNLRVNLRLILLIFTHLVEKCSGERQVITGWSFAPHSRLTKELRKNYDKL